MDRPARNRNRGREELTICHLRPPQILPRPGCASPVWNHKRYGLLSRKNKLPVGGVIVMLLTPLVVVMV